LLISFYNSGKRGTSMYKKEIEILKERDPILRGIIERAGPIEHSYHNDHDLFRSLANAIIYQQLSGKAATTILNRFIALFDGKEFPAPQDVLGASVERLREAGVSKQKAGYLKDLAQKYVDSTLQPERLPDMSDEGVIEHLTQVKGVGPWTAQMYLIFTMGRTNVFPVGDLGFRNGLTRNYGIEDFKDEEALNRVRELWHPYCTVGTLYMWRSLELEE
jgi:DNA-3-methyladenine glycosylase II